MKCLAIVMLSLTPLTAAAQMQDTVVEPLPAPPTEWQLYAEAALNSDSNAEAALGGSYGGLFVEVLARDMLYDKLGTTTARSWPAAPRLVEGEALEVEVSAGYDVQRSGRVCHGPVARYVSRADGRNVVSVGWHVSVGSP